MGSPGAQPAARRRWFRGQHLSSDFLDRIGRLSPSRLALLALRAKLGKYKLLGHIGTGGMVTTSTYISQTIATNATSSRVLALRVVSGRIIGTTHRSDNTVYQRELPVGQVITPAKNSWREIRR